MINYKNIIKSMLPKVVINYRRNQLLNRQRQKFHEGAKTLLFKVDDILSQNGISFWLNYGTLLGAYRENDFIAHDYDLDIGLNLENMHIVKQLLLNEGFKLKYEVHFGGWNNPENLEYRFEYNGAFIDLDFYQIESNTAYTYNPLFIEGVNKDIGKVFPVIAERITNTLKGLESFAFLGRKFNVPQNAELYLEENYGKNWRIPLKDYDYHEIAKNIQQCSQEDFPSYMIIYY